MQTRGTGVLDGIRVLDFTEWLPGPYATKTLAALGADVLKVERPGTGDPARAARPGLFRSQNEGKRAVALDLKSPEGAEAARTLAARADVLLEGFRPGVMARLGLGYDTLAAANPDLIYVSLSGYGADGPYRDRPGHDLNYLALAGAVPRPASGGAGAFRETPLPIADLSGALFALLGVLTALLDRDRHGTGGTWLDVSLADCAVSLMQPRIAEAVFWHDDEAWHHRPGYGVFETADGEFVALGAMEDHFWRRLIEALDLPELGKLDAATYAERRTHFETIDDALRRRVSELSRDEVLARLAAADVPADPVNGLLDPLADEHLRARGMVRGDAGAESISPWPPALRQFMSDVPLSDAPLLGGDDHAGPVGWKARTTRSHP
ncbi:CaiB/BaiF CoA transferase family protein [Streptomyces sp. NPDC001984]